LGLFVLLLFKQFRRPLEEYANVEINFKTPAYLRPPSEETLKQLKDAKEYSGKDEDLWEDPEESHDSHDSLVQELTPMAIKFVEDYEYHHSQYKLEAEAWDCRERTNRDEDESIADTIREDWCPELQSRHYLVVTLNCDENNYNPMGMLQDFLRSVAWAMVTDRTLLYKQNHRNGDDTCSEAEEGCSDSCNGISQVDPWLPRFDVWNKEYEWDFSEDSEVPVVDDISKIDDVNTPKVIMLDRPPPLDLEHLNTLSSKRKAAQLIEWGMTYGMILDESIVMEEPDIPRVDSSDEDLRTHYYAIQASSAQSSPVECPLIYQTPCVIYQVGQDPVNSSECQVEQTTTRDNTKPTSKLTMFQTLAMAGNALDGAVLQKGSPLSELLVELLNYRGRLERVDFHLDLCLTEEDDRQKYLR
jgi:hypothetical protein